MTKVIVTGGCGFIGSHLVTALCHSEYEVTIIDDLSSGSVNNLNHLNKNFTLVNGNICDRDLLKKYFVDVESVFHLAARISVTESIQKPDLYVETNCLGTLSVLEASRQAGVKNFIFSSSAAVYGDDPTIPKMEAMAPKPQSPYAMTKLDGEYYCQLYRDQYQLNTAVLRYFNVFGPKQNPKSPYASVIPIFIDKALSNQDIVIYGDGEQSRDFIFVDDIVNANLAATHHKGDLLNVCNSDRISILELALLIIQLTESTSNIIYAPERAGDIKHSQGDNTKIKNQFGFEPKYTLMQGLTETIKYFYDTRQSIA